MDKRRIRQRIQALRNRAILAGLVVDRIDDLRKQANRIKRLPFTVSTQHAEREVGAALFVDGIVGADFDRHMRKLTSKRLQPRQQPVMRQCLRADDGNERLLASSRTREIVCWILKAAAGDHRIAVVLIR
jgi:hypothetical protein